MNVRQLITVAGAAATSFLLAGAVTIEVLTATIGDNIGPGIVGVFVGAVAGLVAALAVVWRWNTLAVRARAVPLAYASFGLTILFLAFLSYVNIPGVDAYLGFERNLLLAVLVAFIAGLVAWRREGPTRGTGTD